ncbi:MAG: hypothetical protein CSA11_10855 [Chloroflexi bacterium]|nr:MAG: hypothetical protein CSA11_10855 [Chloroflexota bacterium]
MDPFTADFLANLTAELSALLIAKVARRFQKTWQEDDMTEALERCVQFAILAMVSRANWDAAVEALSAEEEGLLSDIFTQFFHMDAVATQILPLVRGKSLDVDELAFLFEEAGYDAATLPGLHFEAAMAAFEAAFLETAAAEPTLQPLIHIHQNWAQTALQKEMVSLLRQMIPLLQEKAAQHHPIGIQAGAIVAENVANQQTIYQTIYQWGGAAPPDPNWESYYLKAVVSHCGDLDLTLLDASEARHERLSVATVFTTLYLSAVTRAADETIAQALSPTPKQVSPEKKERRSEDSDQAERYPIAASEAIAAMPRLVILGEPGGGKSTLTNHIVTQLARRRLGQTDATLPHWPADHTPLPVRIILRRFASWLDKEKRKGEVGDIWAYLEQLLTGWGCADSFPGLKNALRNDGGLIFFDGLDELRQGDARKKIIRGVVERFAASETGCQIVITSRPYAYDADAAWRLPPKAFPVVRLAPFGREQIEAFNQAWYTQVIKPRRDWSLEKCQQEAARLSRTIEARPHLRRLAESPLLLTLIAQVDSSGGGAMQLNNRAELYQRTVTLLLARWDNRIRLDDFENVPEDKILYLKGLPTGELRNVLAELAYNGHREQAQNAPTKADRAVVEIPYQTLRDALLKRFDSLERVEDIIAYIQVRTGLLVDQGGGVFTFPHRTYQEYLAGQHLLTTSGWQPRLVNLLKKAPDWWREVFLLNAASLPAPDSVQFLVQALLPEPPIDSPRQAARLLIAAQALVETNFSYYVALEQQKALTQPEEEEDGFTSFLKRVQSQLEAAMLADEGLPAKTRAAAGRMLAQLGDTRPGVGTVVKNGVLIPDVQWGGEVPPGTYQIGDAHGGHDDEKVRDVVIQRPYRLARYPITNAQFQCFVEASDRDEPAWWDGLPAAEKEFRAPRFPDANHPRDRVSWYQAIAFCRWLSHKLGDEVGLPHENEWEVAARWDGEKADSRMYPWAGDFDANKANTDEGGVGQTTAVGIYPAGKNVALELYDLSGNVWEWCANEDEDLVETAVDEAPCVVRGGSWDYHRSNARVAFRNSLRPTVRYDSFGFRVVCRPPSHFDH